MLELAERVIALTGSKSQIVFRDLPQDDPLQRKPDISLVQLVVNFAWTPVFFGAFQITGGLVLIAVLAVLVIATTAMFWKIRTLAGVLMLPYFAWVLFAMVLNYQFLQLNPEADGGRNDAAAARVRIAD